MKTAEWDDDDDNDDDDDDDKSQREAGSLCHTKYTHTHDQTAKNDECCDCELPLIHSTYMVRVVVFVPPGSTSQTK